MSVLRHGLVPPTATGYNVERSLRFNSADSAYLNRTPGSASNRKIWTWSGWVKRSSLARTADLMLFACRPAGYTLFSLRHANSSSPDSILFEDANGATLITTAKYRDVSAWYHIVLAVDTTQATASNRIKLYVNGSQVTAFSTATYPSQNLDMEINSANAHGVGGYSFNTSEVFDGYMADVHFIDGSALTPSSFGENDTDTGVWKPKAYTGSYGTNGFYLKFADNSGTTSTTLGKDSSGNGNNWTPNNFSVTAGAGNDSLVDTPTPYGTDTGAGGNVRGNYCTLNPIDKNSGDVVKNGNLDAEVAGYRAVVGTVAVTSGKWYWEVTPTGNSGSLNYMLGIADANSALTTRGWVNANGWYYFYDGRKFNNSTGASYGASYTTNDVIGVALDMDAGTVTFYKNGSSQGQAYSGLTGKAIQPSVSDGSSSSFQYYTCNFGQRPFAYTAPSGFKALCTTNLPTPTIGATSSTRADDYFNTVLWTGNSSTQAVTVGFQPDLLWLKRRDGANASRVFDAVRGKDNYLITSSTAAEANFAYLSSFDSNGFTLNSGDSATNTSGGTYVGWNWKANGAGSSNTAGSITSTVSANTTSGFSIVTFTGNGTAGATVGHGLGVAPKMIIVKSRGNARNWLVYHASVGATQFLQLDTTIAATTSTTAWNDTAPSSTVFTLGTSNAGNESSITRVAYCFAEVVEYSRFGSYTGNGSADGPMIFTGFRPRWIMVKGSTATTNWTVIDTARDTYNA